MAEKICIGCTQIRPSNVEEKNSFSLDSTLHNIIEDTEVSLSPTTDPDNPEPADIIEAPCVDLDSVNPHNSSFKTVIIHNVRCV